MSALPLPFPSGAISLTYGAVDGEYYTAASPHQGVDFSSRSRGIGAGTPIPASGSGRVVRSGVGPVGVTPNINRPNNLSGNSIDVDYGDVIVRYMHRPYDSPSPAVGSTVSYGSSLGLIGSTGQVSAAHLHMDTWDKATGRRVNPALFFDFNRYVGDGTGASSGGTPFNPEEADMPLNDADILRIQNAVWGMRGGADAPMITNRRTGQTEYPADTLGWMQERIRRETLPQALKDFFGDGFKAILDALFSRQVRRYGLPEGSDLAKTPTTLEAVIGWSDANNLATRDMIGQAVKDALKDVQIGPGGSVDADAVAAKVADTLASRLAA